MTTDEREINRKRRILDHADESGYANKRQVGHTTSDRFITIFGGENK